MVQPSNGSFNPSVHSKSSAISSGFVRTRHIAAVDIPPHHTMSQLSGSDLDEPLLHDAPRSPASHASSICHPRFFFSGLAAILCMAIFAFVPVPMLIRSLPRALRPGPASLKPGFSIVAACANRHRMLEKSLPSWLTVENLDQIVIVDWSSSPPLFPTVNSIYQQVSSPIPVRVIRVENETEWVLSRAYNLAFHHASHQVIFKVDCDYVTDHVAISNHPLDSSMQQFYAGYYENARSASEMHLNGALIVLQTAFWSIGGYDERIQTYGFDDEDMYIRLTDAGHKRLNMSFDHISHLDHDDSRRGQKGIRFPRVQIEMNKLLLQEIGTSWTMDSQPSQYRVIDKNQNHLEAVFTPPNLASFVSEDKWHKLRSLALGRRLHDQYSIPWGVISSMNISASEKTLSNLNDRSNEMEFDEVKDGDNAPRFIIIHVQNGLGNRLRSLGSGLAFAERTKRVPIVIWESDVHFGALFSDLFEDSKVDFGVIDAFKMRWPLADRVEYDSAWGKIQYFNYMLSDGVGQEIQDDPSMSVYFKSSAIMNSSLTNWESENSQIRRLVIQEDIMRMAENVYGEGMTGVGGVHIRNRSLEEDIVGVSNNRRMYSKGDAALIDKWRATTKVSNFVGEMRGLLDNGTVDKFFVASDTIAVCHQLQDDFPRGNVVFIPRDCDDRGATCDRFALADVIVLSRSKVLLGSTWSSFTEAAMRLGGPKALLAGTDFGKGPKKER